jgi:tRNA threonylcarbamoyladenosine biosynthesis protein TsaB
VETLVPAIQLLLSNLGITIHDLSAIAVDLGPGLFTGMRVGIATAQCLAAISDLPIIGVDSLYVVAHGVSRLANEELNRVEVVVPVLDARRNQVYWSMFRAESSVNPLVAVREPRVGDIEELIEDLLDRGQEALLVGTGAVKFAEQLSSVVQASLVGNRTGVTHFTHNPHVPHASSLVALAAERIATGHHLGGLPEPIYLRAPDAEINWVTR